MKNKTRIALFGAVVVCVMLGNSVMDMYIGPYAKQELSLASVNGGVVTQYNARAWMEINNAVNVACVFVIMFAAVVLIGPMIKEFSASVTKTKRNEKQADPHD